MKPTEEEKEVRAHVEGRVIYLLILVIVLHTIYPITIDGSLPTRIIYQVLYSLMILAGILVAGDSRLHQRITVTSGIIWLLASILFALDPTSTWKILLTYLFLAPFQATVIWVLLRYIAIMRVVNRDVLFAAVTVYLLLAAVFVPVYGSIELLAPGSFVDNLRPDRPVFWQQLVYFSFVTLTTAGYGDVVPVSDWARVLATVQATIGVLYLAVMMARLVGLYAQERA